MLQVPEACQLCTVAHIKGVLFSVPVVAAQTTEIHARKPVGTSHAQTVVTSAQSIISGCPGHLIRPQIILQWLLTVFNLLDMLFPILASL